MKNLICFILIWAGLNWSGCKSKDSTEEIKIKKNEVIEQNNNRTTEEEKTDDDKSGERLSKQIITSKEVKQHIGDSITIKGFVADVFMTDKVAYLNFENKFPKNVFACAVFSSKFEEFGDLSKYKNKNVEVTGKISTYKNKPQVILESNSQIKIIP
ncbi:MAG: hypothetical protein M3R36_03675 [Bacteroidota bacterium]|nr:hypothetical protein [Bacteroidota bacterium]